MLSGATMGQPFSVSTDGNGLNQRFYIFQNIDVTAGFTVNTDLTIAGTFSDGKRGKVELVPGCPV